MSEKASSDLGRTLRRILYQNHHPVYISPDPLELVREFDDPREREVAALIGALFAVGRVPLIIRAVEQVFSALQGTGGLHRAVSNADAGELRERLGAFSYRFFDVTETAALLKGIGVTLRQYGTLENAFVEGYRVKQCVYDGTVALVTALTARDTPLRTHLVPDPRNGSACKRLHLFLRWMVRSDSIDPGGWNFVDASELIVPLDTHLQRIARTLGLTQRRSADLRTARDITCTLREFDPADPVRFDFALTRIGINPEANFLDLRSEAQ